MAGTKIGGMKAAATNKARHGENFYAVLGAKGGRNGHTGGFTVTTPCLCGELPDPHKKAQCAGRKGGINSRRRGKAETTEVFKKRMEVLDEVVAEHFPEGVPLNG